MKVQTFASLFLMGLLFYPSSSSWAIDPSVLDQIRNGTIKKIELPHIHSQSDLIREVEKYAVLVVNDIETGVRPMEGSFYESMPARNRFYLFGLLERFESLFPDPKSIAKMKTVLKRSGVPLAMAAIAVAGSILAEPSNAQELNGNPENPSAICNSFEKQLVSAEQPSRSEFLSNGSISLKSAQ